ncbi:MAG: twin-arginine translocase TatA/TatE family subunit [Pyrinomonadaceae bacterium]
MVLLLILESFGSTELLFILVMALVFFGPRKLPQISRSLGKSLAEFRRASEDFKRTWEKEVAMENPLADLTNDGTIASQETARYENNLFNEPSTEHAVPRQSRTNATEDNLTTVPGEPAEEKSTQDTTLEPLQKRNWL